MMTTVRRTPDTERICNNNGDRIILQAEILQTTAAAATAEQLQITGRVYTTVLNEYVQQCIQSSCE